MLGRGLQEEHSCSFIAQSMFIQKDGHGAASKQAGSVLPLHTMAVHVFPQQNFSTTEVSLILLVPALTLPFSFGIGRG